MPLTVFSYAPVNLAASKFELNIPLMNAVFLWILKGSPISFSFFITLNWVFTSTITPVAQILK